MRPPMRPLLRPPPLTSCAPSGALPCIPRSDARNRGGPAGTHCAVPTAGVLVQTVPVQAPGTTPVLVQKAESWYYRRVAGTKAEEDCGTNLGPLA
eukprot:2234382-Rhodomonas_salina.1